MRRRPGFTLIEMTIALSVGTMLLVIATGLIHQSMTIASKYREIRGSHQQSDRLCQQFRTDAREATQIKSDGAKTLQFIDGDTVVTYRVEAERVTRHRDGQEAADSIEEYTLAVHRLVELGEHEENIAQLSIWRQLPERSDQRYLERRCAIQVGRWNVKPSDEALEETP